MRTLRRFGFFLFVWTIYFTLRKLPFHTRLRAMHVLAFIVYWLWKGGRERITRNISLIRPDLTEEETAKGSWQVAKTIARSWAALLGSEFTNVEEIGERVEVIGIEKLLDYHRNGKRVIVVMDHVGPIDEMLGIIPLFGLRVYIPAEFAKPEWFFHLMRRLRMSIGDIISEAVGKNLIKTARYLFEGRILILLIDVPRQDGSGVLCRIGRAQARFSVGAIKFALKYDAAIFPAFPSLNEDGKAKIVFGSPFGLIKTGNIDYDTEMNTRRLIEEVYTPHIRENYHGWLRLLWENLEPVSF